MYRHHGMGISFTFISAYLISIFSVMVILFNRSKYVRWAGTIALFFLLSANLSYRFINKVGIFPQEIMVAMTKYGNFGDALSTFGLSIVLGTLVISGLFAGIFFAKRYFTYRFHIGLSLFIILPFLLSIISIDRRYLPSFIRIPLLYASALTTPHYYGKREKVKLVPDQSKKIKNIIFIIDESMRGDFFQINGYERETTPYLKSIPHKIVNFGIASSGSNCSLSSNTILLSGLQPDRIPDKEFTALKSPNIFQYAKKAGYKTYFYDAQARNGKLLNSLTSYDLEYVDVFFQIRNEYKIDNDENNDSLVVDEIAKNKTDKTRFILINKYGAHFRYEHSYPEKEKHFTPTMSYKEFMLNASKEKVINSYLNTIRWGVDHFFQKLLTVVDLENTIIVYTSDHGQSILEGNSVMTHCSSNPPATQAIVPLFLFGNKINRYFYGDISHLVNTRSHFQIFSTLLNFMGYNSSEVEKNYGKNLWQIDNKNSFYWGNIFDDVRKDPAIKKKL